MRQLVAIYLTTSCKSNGLAPGMVQFLYLPRSAKPKVMHTNASTYTQPRIFFALTLLLVLSIVGCSRKIPFTTSTAVPAAVGRVKMKKDNNNNYALNLEVRNLAEPKRLATPQNVYIVWMETSDGLKNIGQLKTGSNLLSKTLKASLNTVTPLKPNRIFVTAENNASISYPGAQVVLSTNPF